MSAWMTSNRHQAFVAKAAEVHGLIPPGSADAFAAVLREENIKSLQARYPSDWSELMYQEPGEGADLDPVAGFIEDPGYVAKAAGCLRYQSCEHDQWEGSETAVIVDKLADLAPYSDTAPWGID